MIFAAAIEEYDRLVTPTDEGPDLSSWPNAKLAQGQTGRWLYS